MKMAGTPSADRVWSGPADVESLVRSGRLASVLLAILGVVTTLGQYLVDALPLGVATTLCGAALVVALIVRGLPWARFPPAASLVPVLLALVLLGWPVPMPVSGYVVLLPVYSVVFLYVGLTQRPGMALLLSPLGAVSIFLPLLVVDQTSVAVPAGIVLVTAVLTGETLATHMVRHRKAWEATQTSLTSLAALLDSYTVVEARDRLISGLTLLLRGAQVTVTLTAPPDRPAAPTVEVPGWSAHVLPLQVVRAVSTLDLGTVAIRVPSGPGAAHQREELAAAHILIGEAAKILHRLQEAENLADQAGRDPLTGVANRRTLFRETMNIGPADVLVMLDLDHFKRVNDTLGHAEGDRELVRLARALNSFARPGDCVARVGGEEFALLLRAITAADAATWLDRVRLHLRPDSLTTFSTGVAVHRPGDTPEDTLARADRALYQAKLSGRNRTRLAEPAGAPAAGRAPHHVIREDLAPIDSSRPVGRPQAGGS